MIENGPWLSSRPMDPAQKHICLVVKMRPDQIILNDIHRFAVRFHKDRFPGPAAQSLDTDTTASRKEIQKCTSVDTVLQDIEKRFLDSVRCRPGVIAVQRLKEQPSGRACDHSHK